MIQTDAERAYHLIKQKIVTLELLPGAVIVESQEMTSLGLGRTPIREALKKLQTETLVIIRPRRGIFVADIAITDLTQIYEVRVEVEAACARLAAQRFTLPQLAEMQKLVRQGQRAENVDMKRLMRIDRCFHKQVARGARNKFLLADWTRYYDLSQRIWYLALNAIQPSDIGFEDHIGIAAAIMNRDWQQAEQRMRNHIIHFQKTMKQNL